MAYEDFKKDFHEEYEVDKETKMSAQEIEVWVKQKWDELEKNKK